MTRSQLDALRATLAARAATEGLLEVAWATMSSPIGPLLIAATSQGVVRIAFECENFDAVRDELAVTVSPRVLHASSRLAVPIRQLRAYFAKEREGFALPVDWRLAEGFRGEVQHELVHIGYGETLSYGALAARAGRPSAVRAAASACATNPLPIVVPCHRVIRSDGSVGGYRGGRQAKEWLLALEASGVS